MDAEQITTDAMTALREGRPEDARKLLREALDAAPERPDILHAVAVLELQLGEAGLARQILAQAEQVAMAQADEAAAKLMPQIKVAEAAAAEDLYEPEQAEQAYLEVLEVEFDHPRAVQGLAYLYLAQGKTQDGLALLERYVADAKEGPEYAQGNLAMVEAIKKFIAEDVHPREFLVAHRGSYVQFFDHHADRLAAEGWIAEAAKMMRGEDGRPVPIIPEGARPYAAIRVDLVDPKTGQPGQIGDQPMVVAIAGYEPLAQAPVLFDFPTKDFPFPVWVSSQAPWDQLPIQIRLHDPMPEAMGAALAEAFTAADAVIGDWYSSGYHGDFGTPDKGRFHYISDPETPNPLSGVMSWAVDLGRAKIDAIDALLRRLEVLHASHPIECVVLGRGYLPGGG